MSGLKRRKRGSRTTPATLVLDRLGIEYQIHEFVHDAREQQFGLEAARELEVSSSQVFKTLLVEIDSGYGVALCPVSSQLNMKLVAASLESRRATLADRDVAERITGYVTGGISAFGMKRRVPIVIDNSVRHLETVYISAGRRGLDLELASDDLIRASDAVVAAIIR